jgi:dihydropteroate synthase
MAAIISGTGASCVLMATSTHLGDSCTPDQIIKALKNSLQLTSKAEISPEKIVVDPGIGFGKPTNCDLRIILALREFRVLNHPILVGVSRKSFIGEVLGYPAPEDRLAGTLAAVTFALLEGAHILRSHDVRETRDCVKIVNAIQLAKESD